VAALAELHSHSIIEVNLPKAEEVRSKEIKIDIL